MAAAKAAAGAGGGGGGGGGAAAAAAAAGRCFENEDYMFVEALKLGLSRENNTQEDGTFTLCFWMYLLRSSNPGCIIRQASNSSKAPSPFLTVDASLKVAMHPLPSQGCVLVSDEACPYEKWVHLGCEVGHSIARLHMDGVITGEMPLSNLHHDALPSILFGGDDFRNVQAYVHHICALPHPSVTNHYVKNPPLELSLDGSTGGTDDHEVEEGGDGVWSVVGGKASCRRNFALDVVLLDALGRSVHKDLELVASLVYADTGAPVEKPKDDAEAPLLTTFDGVEFPSTERPIKLVHGRASFKLKISQLSSKCDNRLFRVCFESPSTPKFPFLRVLSRPIRCVSRNRNSRAPSAPWKRAVSAMYPPDVPESSQGAEDKGEPSRLNNDSSNSSAAYKAAPPSKASRTSEERAASRFQAPVVEFQGLCKVEAVPEASTSDWASAQMPAKLAKTGFPDYLVFKYCLETISSRAAFLLGAVSSKSDEELNEFAVRVSQCTGCHHNGYQILIAKGLLQDGEDLWKQVSREGATVCWSSVLSKLEVSFCGQTRRRLTDKDKEFLRGVCGCGESISREQFDRLWYWFYPVTMTISSRQVRKAWESSEPRWIEGMVSRKEAEEGLLKSAAGDAGTFVLRFATRYWPHPDAGAMVVSYVDAELKVCHRLLNIDNRACSGGDVEELSELLLSQQELLRPLSLSS